MSDAELSAAIIAGDDIASRWDINHFGPSAACAVDSGRRQHYS